MKEGLTFNDVLLTPKKSIVNSRSDIDVSTDLTKNLRLKIPLISASMDTVTEAEMAIALGKEGGLGILHRFMEIEKLVEEVRKVKQNNVLVGAAIGANNGYLAKAESLVNAGVDVLSIDIAHGHSKIMIDAIKNIKQKFDIDLIAGNIATRNATEDLIEAGADCVKIGVGPGSTCTTRVVTGAGVPQLSAIMDVYEYCKKKNIPLIADGGIRSSGDMVKALVGGASAIMCGSLFSGTDESPGNIVEKDNMKYKVFRGMASKSAAIKNMKINNGDTMGLDKIIMPEGVEAYVKYKGSVTPIIKKLVMGIKSGISYCGSVNIEELRENAEFIKMTKAGLSESLPHDVEFM